MGSITIKTTLRLFLILTYDLPYVDSNIIWKYKPYSSGMLERYCCQGNLTFPIEWKFNEALKKFAILEWSTQRWDFFVLNSYGNTRCFLKFLHVFLTNLWQTRKHALCMSFWSMWLSFSLDPSKWLRYFKRNKRVLWLLENLRLLNTNPKQILK